jgi:DNA-binding NtrC family response regulator
MNPHPAHNPSLARFAPGPKPPTVLRANTASKSLTDAKLASLKILAMTLLKEIESMEGGNETNAKELCLHDEVHRFEAEMIKSALTKTGGRQRRAASLLGVKVTTLNTKIKRYKIMVSEASAKSSEAEPTQLVESRSEIIF